MGPGLRFLFLRPGLLKCSAFPFETLQVETLQVETLQVETLQGTLRFPLESPLWIRPCGSVRVDPINKTLDSQRRSNLLVPHSGPSALS